MSMNFRALFSIVAVLLVACSQESSLPRISAPPLPDDMSSFDAAIARQIETEAAALNRDRQNATRWREFGMLYHAHDQFDLAAACYAQSLLLAPGDARAHYHLAQVQRRRGRMNEAIAAMQKASELDTTYAPARWRLGLWLLEEGDPAAALSAAESALALATDDRATMLVLARAHLQQGEAGLASELLEAWLASHSDDRYAHFLLAGAYRRLGRGEDARRHATLGQTAEPGFHDAWSDEVEAKRAGFPAALATATELIGSDPARAVTALQRLRKERPDNGTVLINLGIAHRLVGDLEASSGALREAVRREPARGLAHFHLAVTYAQQSRLSGENAALKTALEHAGRAVELQPTSVRAHALEGELLAQAGRPAAAVDSYRKAVRDPQDTTWLYRLGDLLCQLGRWQEAVPVLEEFLERAPGNPDALFLLGVAQANAGWFDEAVANLGQARRLRPEDPRIRQALLQLERARAAAAEK